MTNANPVERDMALWELQLHYIIRMLPQLTSTNPQHTIFVQMHHCTMNNLSVLPTTVNSMWIDSNTLNRCQSN